MASEIFGFAIAGFLFYIMFGIGILIVAWLTLPLWLTAVLALFRFLLEILMMPLRIFGYGKNKQGMKSTMRRMFK